MRPETGAPLVENRKQDLPAIRLYTERSKQSTSTRHVDPFDSCLSSEGGRAS